MSERWIVIPNWKRYQHYQDRIPKWVKTYTELMSDDSYLGLSLHARGVLHGIWLEYATARGQLLGSTLTLSRRLGERVSTATLESLANAGFIEFSASRPVRHKYKTASPEVEGSKEPSTEKSALAREPDEAARAARREETLSRARELAATWNGGGTDLLHEQLDELEREAKITFTDQERFDLINLALEANTNVVPF